MEWVKINNQWLIKLVLGGFFRIFLFLFYTPYLGTVVCVTVRNVRGTGSMSGEIL